jgi:hypothetical protein
MVVLASSGWTEDRHRPLRGLEGNVKERGGGYPAARLWPRMMK